MAQEKIYARLWLMPLNNASRVRHLTDVQTYKNSDPGLNFIPDNKRIVYSSNESGNNEISTTNADGLNRQQLTFSSEFATEPITMPGNRDIVFTF